MNEQSDATLSGIAATKWLAFIEEHVEFMSATLHTLVLDLERAGFQIMGVPTTTPLQREIEIFKAGMRRVTRELEQLEDAHGSGENARQAA